MKISDYVNIGPVCYNTLYTQAGGLITNEGFKRFAAFRPMGNCIEYSGIFRYSNLKEEKNNIVPIYIDEISEAGRRRTASSIFTLWAKERRSRAIRVTTKAGEVYYGNSWLILDSELNPIFHRCFRWNKEENTIVTVFRISSFVFENNFSIEKNIIKYIIPTIASGVCSTSRGYVQDKGNEIIISDTDPLILSPLRPSVNTTSKDIQNFLIKYFKEQQ